MMAKPELLDLFCGAGGAAVGYHRAGFDVYGIDNKPQPRYPFPFLQMDALEAMDRLLRGEGLTFSNGETLYLNDFTAFHASPPCQGYSNATKNNSQWVSYSQGKQTPRLINPVRNILTATGNPFVIENVDGSEVDLQGIFYLCGLSFGLPITRHRFFYSSIPILAPGHYRHNGQARRYAKARDWEYRDMSVTGKGRRAGCLQRWQEIMGIDWDMRQSDIVEAIPPAYTEYLGKYLMQAVLASGDER